MGERFEADRKTDQKTHVADASAGTAPWSILDAGKADIDYYRNSLNKMGIDPDAALPAKIGIYEPAVRVMEHETEQEAERHRAHVGQTINGKAFGLTRNAKTETLTDGEIQVDPAKFQDQPDGLAKLSSAFGVAAMDSLTNAVSKHVVNGDVKILNVSQAYAPVVFGSDLREALTADTQKYGKFIKSIMGNDDGAELIDSLESDKATHLSKPSAKTSKLTEELMVDIVHTAENTLDKDQAFQSAMTRYRDITKQAAQQNKFVVVGAGNYHMALANERRPESEFSWYAMSHDVISVGGTYWNSNAIDTASHSMYFGSSSGTKEFHPTLVANSVPPGAVNMGTSFSTPRTVSTIDMMLGRNPRLTFGKAKQIFEQTSLPRQGEPIERQGAGELQVDLAVLAANSRSRQ